MPEFTFKEVAGYRWSIEFSENNTVFARDISAILDSVARVRERHGETTTNYDPTVMRLEKSSNRGTYSLHIALDLESDSE
jgi:hypothetical protein